ncbi:hypothetical protein [Klebsiella variicola]
MEWLTLVATSAVVSAVVSGLLTLWNAHLQRKAEERKRLAELAMKWLLLNGNPMLQILRTLGEDHYSPLRFTYTGTRVYSRSSRKEN